MSNINDIANLFNVDGDQLVRDMANTYQDITGDDYIFELTLTELQQGIRNWDRVMDIYTSSGPLIPPGEVGYEEQNAAIMKVLGDIQRPAGLAREQIRRLGEAAERRPLPNIIERIEEDTPDITEEPIALPLNVQQYVGELGDALWNQPFEQLSGQVYHDRLHRLRGIISTVSSGLSRFVPAPIGTIITSPLFTRWLAFTLNKHPIITSAAIAGGGLLFGLGIKESLSLIGRLAKGAIDIYNKYTLPTPPHPLEEEISGVDVVHGEDVDNSVIDNESEVLEPNYEDPNIDIPEILEQKQQTPFEILKVLGGEPYFEERFLKRNIFPQ